MDDCVTFDGVEKVFRVKYPFTEDPSLLTNDFNQVIMIGKYDERKLAKKGLTEAFNQELKKMMEYGALIVLK